MSWSDYRKGKHDAKRYAKKGCIDRAMCDIFGGGYSPTKRTDPEKKHYDNGWDNGFRRR